MSQLKPDRSRHMKLQHGPMSAAATVHRPELLLDGSDREFRRLVHGLLAFAVRLNAVRDGFARLIGVSGTQYTIMIAISHLGCGNPITVNMVADHLHLSGAFITIETGRLLKRGLLTKTQDSKDRRRVCLRVTPKGYDLLQALAPVQARVNDVLFDFLNAAQFRQVLGALDQVISCGDRAVSLLQYLSQEQIAADQGFRSPLLKTA